MPGKKILPPALEYASNTEYTDYSDRDEAEFTNYAYQWFADPEHENSVKHMYLDTNGIVTIGVGHAIQQVEGVKKLPFHFRKPLNPPREVTEDDKVEEYKKIKALWSSLKTKKTFPLGNSSIFRTATNLDLEEDGIKDLFEEDIKSFLKKLKETFPLYDKYPDEAKLGLLDMSYNLGHSGLVTKFPKLVRAAKMEDWASVSNECHRNGIGQKRNIDTKDLFQKAAKKVEINEEAKPLLLPDNEPKSSEKDFSDMWA